MSEQLGEKDSIKPDFNELKGLEKKYGKEPEISEKQLLSWH